MGRILEPSGCFVGCVVEHECFLFGQGRFLALRPSQEEVELCGHDWNPEAPSAAVVETRSQGLDLLLLCLCCAAHVFQVRGVHAVVAVARAPVWTRFAHTRPTAAGIVRARSSETRLAVMRQFDLDAGNEPEFGLKRSEHCLVTVFEDEVVFSDQVSGVMMAKPEHVCYCHSCRVFGCSCDEEVFWCWNSEGCFGDGCSLGSDQVK